VEAPFLIFRLGTSLFGVPAFSVREIHVLPALASLPETAPFIIGVLNLRGAIVPVMDLNARMGEDAPPYRLSDTLVVLHYDGADVAILVSEVIAVERLAATQIQPAPTHGRQRDVTAPFIAGVTQIGDGIVMLLHLPHLLDWDATIDASTETSISKSRFDAQTWSSADRAILEERASRLRPTVADDAEENGERAPVALLALGGEEMGIELSAVHEFVSVNAVTPVPCCPPHILGQINLRGDIVTLVDVRVALRTARTSPPCFEGASREREPQNAVTVVVVQHEGAPVGIVIDEVRDVLYLREDERTALDANVGGGQSGKYFSGGALHQGRLLPLLDVARLFTEGGLEVDEGA
jgi:purine-binding chemotaxis protein CheW